MGAIALGYGTSAGKHNCNSAMFPGPVAVGQVPPASSKRWDNPTCSLTGLLIVEIVPEIGTQPHRAKI